MAVESEDAFYLEACEAALAEVEGLLAEAVAGEESWLGKFRQGLACLVDILEGRPEMGRVLFAEVGVGGAAARERWGETLRRAARFVDLARDEPGALSPPQISADAVVAGIYGLLRSQLEGAMEPKLRESVPDLTYYAVLPYFGEEVARREMVAARRE